MMAHQLMMAPWGCWGVVEAAKACYWNPSKSVLPEESFLMSLCLGQGWMTSEPCLASR